MDEKKFRETEMKRLEKYGYKFTGRELGPNELGKSIIVQMDGKDIRLEYVLESSNPVLEKIINKHKHIFSDIYPDLPMRFGCGAVTFYANIVLDDDILNNLSNDKLDNKIKEAFKSASRFMKNQLDLVEPTAWVGGESVVSIAQQDGVMFRPMRDREAFNIRISSTVWCKCETRGMNFSEAPTYYV